MRRLLALFLLAGCDNELSFGRLSDGNAQPFSCDLRGPSFAVGDGDPNCDGSGFHHALCSCGDYVSSGSTVVDGFDSRTGALAAGSLALGGALSAGDVRVGGALIIAGDNGAPLTGDLDVGGLLLSRGPVQGSQQVTVGGDARIADDVRLASFSVGGTLTLPAGAALELSNGVIPSTVRAPVMVLPPCDCTAVLDIGAQIDAARFDNDDAKIALDPELGLRTFDSVATLDLSCGRYYVRQVYAAQPITIAVHGRVALYIDQRVVTETSGGLTIALDADAQLDIFLRQGITGAGPIEIKGGSTHIYVGGNDSLFFAAPTTLEASLYAPNSELVAQQRLELRGGALLRRAVAERDVILHQDVALANGACTY